MISLNLLVLRAKEPERLSRFYENLGLEFTRERHGSGPEHHACTLGASVIEIYPLAPGGIGTSRTRIGFAVDLLDDAIEAISADCGTVVSPPKDTPWGRRAVVRDPEGHLVELTERSDRV